MGAIMGTSIFLMGVCFMIFLTPFIVCDLYYAYNDTSCVNNVITNYNISFTLATWLKVNGWILVSIVSICLILGIVICCSPTVGVILGSLFALIIGFMGVFNLIWIIIGSIMFWGDLDKTKLCNKGLSDYMYARLIICIIGICCGGPAYSKKSKGLEGQT